MREDRLTFRCGGYTLRKERTLPRTPTTTEIPLPEEVENAVRGLSVEQEDGSLTTVRLLLERIREDVAAIERTLGSNHLFTLATKDLMKANQKAKQE